MVDDAPDCWLEGCDHDADLRLGLTLHSAIMFTQNRSICFNVSSLGLYLQQVKSKRMHEN